MQRPLWVQGIALALAAGLLYGSAQLVPPINRQRADLNMYGDADVGRNAPPEYAFWIQAFGAFRSLIVDIAFIRAENYKDKGRYYDAMQLAEWICKLQPHFPAVWEFHSWNMAWNISVTTFTPQERWHWVYNGVRLLRDEGLRFNPRAVNLYKQLAWIFNNKMGADIDEFNLAYKRNWAYRMHLLLGPPPAPPRTIDTDRLLSAITFDIMDDPLYRAARTTDEQLRAEIEAAHRARGEDWRPDESTVEQLLETAPRTTTPATLAAKQASLDRIEAIAAAPDRLSELYAQHPEAQAIVAELRKMGIPISDDPLTEDAYEQPQGLLHSFFLPYREVSDPSMWARMGSATERVPPHVRRLGELLGVGSNSAAGEALVHFLQRKVLREVYKNDPAHMADLVRQFGPIDWRLVDSQSLYWATKALILSEGTVSDFSNDKTNTVRIVLFSLQNMARRNKLFFEPLPGDPHYSYLNMMPDPSFIESMNAAYLRYAARFDPQRRGGPGVGDLFSSGHVNFLIEGIRTLYFAGRTEAAQRYYDYLRAVYGYNAQGVFNERYTKPLRDFVVDTYYESIGIQADAARTVAGLIQQSLAALTTGELEQSTAYLRQAREIHARFNEMKHEVAIRRMSLPPFADMYTDEFGYFLAMPAQSYALTLEKARLWNVAPVFLRQRVYDALLPLLSEECEAFGLDVRLAFAEPPGMDEFRRANPIRSRPEDEGITVTPVQPNTP